jgi:dTDP-4-amino-4,6-dideoxygalactose transaminase
MIQLSDYSNPFQAILDFESALAHYAGAPYCVTTNCCTHAMELALRITHRNSTVKFPAKTYISVLMVLHKLNIPYELLDVEWKDFYHLQGSRVWDCARYLEPGMYCADTIQCVSFGRTKPLEIGIGGCLFTDDFDVYRKASMMRSDGRDLFNHKAWVNQKVFPVGYHYTMKPEDCVTGLNLLAERKFTKQIPQFYNYPDCRQIEIVDHTKI